VNVGTRTTLGTGRILGKPGVYHLPKAHDYTPSRWYENQGTTESLCGRTSGVVYADTLANLWPDDRLCKLCERRAA
jgi:hypothetical protein